MTFQAAQVAVSTTPTLLSAASESDDRSGQSLAVLTCDIDIYLGGSNSVTSSTGAKLPAGSPIGIDLQSGEAVYAVTASGSGTAHVLRTGV